VLYLGTNAGFDLLHLVYESVNGVVFLVQLFALAWAHRHMPGDVLAGIGALVCALVARIPKDVCLLSMEQAVAFHHIRHVNNRTPGCFSCDIGRQARTMPSQMVRVYADRLVVAAEGQIICEHQRLIERNHHGAGQTVYDWRHYLAVLQRKPGALRNGAPFLELPVAFKRLQTALLKQPGGDREMVEVLALVLHHDEQAVLAAVELALESGAASKTHILNVLHRLLDGKPAPAPVTSPQALKLSVEPQANVLRYDQLREVRYAS